MGVYKRGGSWYIEWYVGYKRYRQSVGPTTRREALKAYGKRKVEVKENRIFDKKLLCDMTFEEMVDDYLAYSKEHKKSHKSNVDVCRRLGRFFGGRKVRDVQPSDIENYKHQRRNHITTTGKPVAVSTINRELACLKRMYNRLIMDRKIDFNPMKYVKLFNEDHLQRDRVLTPEEFLRLYDNSDQDLRPIIEMAYYTAMRRGEILNLTWDRVDLKSGFIRLNPEDTKTARKRMIPLNDRLLEILRERLPQRFLSPHVFHRNGQRIKSIKEGFMSACERAGIENFRFHDLRHTAITRWVKKGVPESAIMCVSGHATRKVFDRYVNLTAEDVRTMLTTADQEDVAKDGVAG
jgi:integrase